MGQTRQEELVNYILEQSGSDNEFLQSLFINLSPYTRTSDDWKSKMRTRDPVVIKKKKTARQSRIEDLEAELKNLKLERERLRTEWNSLKKYKTEGMHVHSNSFGDGQIIKVDGDRIIVRFGKDEKTMSLKTSFERGLLTSEYDDYYENRQKRILIKQEAQKNLKAIEKIQCEIDGLMI